MSHRLEKFPKIQEFPHFHYNCVRLSALSIHPIVGDQSDQSVVCRVVSRHNSWTIRRSLQQFRSLDALLHACVVSRDFSLLSAPLARPDVAHYCRRLNDILVTSGLSCVSVLNWFESDESGNHIHCEESELNCRSVGAAFVVKHVETSRDLEFQVLECLEIGDLVSIIEFDSVVDGSARFWSKGKKGFQVGFLPSDCVQRISNSLESFSLLTTCGGRQDDSEDDDWRRHTSFRKKKDSRISAFFHKWRQNRIQSEATPPTTPTTTLVFGTDLCEHLFDQKTQIPEVLRFCIEFIEKNGIINGIYRLSGISSEIQKLRQIFDRKEIPEFDHKDVHCVSSLLKLYFRSLPNPLLTFHLYDAFVVAIRETTPSSSRRLSQIRRLVARLPPPHARTLAALVRHLNLVSKEWPKTGMNAKNLAIVWAPNLLRSRDLENRLGADLAALQVIGIQAVLTEYLIDNYDHVFALKEPERATVRDSCRHSTSFCRLLPKELVFRAKSLNSFFAKSRKMEKTFESFLKFAKIQTIEDLNRISPQFVENSVQFLPFFSTQETPETSLPVITCSRTHSPVHVTQVIVANDEQKRRLRIERLKSERRQQLKQMFESKPLPTPRKTVANKWKQIAPKVDTRRPATTPVPTPRRRSADATPPTTTTLKITVLKTKSENKRKTFETKFV